MKKLQTYLFKLLILNFFVFMGLLLFSCKNDYVYRNLGNNPSKDWVGKTVEIKFGECGVFTDKTYIVELKSVNIEKSVRTNEQFLYFETDKKFEKDYYDRIYFYWFNQGFGKGIISCRELIRKDELPNEDNKIYVPKLVENEPNNVLEFFTTLPGNFLGMGGHPELWKDEETRRRSITVNDSKRNFLKVKYETMTGYYELLMLRDSLKNRNVVAINYVGCGPCCNSELTFVAHNRKNKKFIDITNEINFILPEPFKSNPHGNVIQLLGQEKGMLIISNDDECPNSKKKSLRKKYLWQNNKFEAVVP